MNQMLSHWCFCFTTNGHMYEAWKTGEYVDKKGVMVEEWKARRKEWKKKRRKKREKVVLGKVLFVFVWLCLPLPFFPCTHHTTTPQHTLTQHMLTHHPSSTMQHGDWCTPSHANRAVCCAAFFFFFGSGQWNTLHHPHPTLHLMTSHNTPTNPNTDTAHDANNNEMTNGQWEGEWDKKGKKMGQHSSTNTLIEVATTQ